MASTPTISTPLLASQSQSQPQSLPDSLSPDSIDAIPVLSALLSRLQTPTSTSSTSTTGDTPAAPADSNPNKSDDDGPIAIKDFPKRMDSMKRKLQRARVAAKELPDIERTVKEQQEEIRELEERIRMQTGVLEGLRGEGVRVGAEREGRMET
jgi:hypothetical protein